MNLLSLHQTLIHCSLWGDYIKEMFGPGGVEGILQLAPYPS